MASPRQGSDDGRPHRTALVLAGGAARGSYEVGVARHLLEDVSRTLGRDVPLDLLCGTSVGAINVCALAAWADDPRGRAARLERAWTGLRVADIVRPDAGEVFDLLRGLVGKPRPVKPGDTRRGGIFDPSGLEAVIRRVVPFGGIAENLAAGRLHAVSLSTTHVASGRTVVFVQRAGGGLPPWGSDPTTDARAVELTCEHALASAAIPLLFPAVRIGGQFYSDGGLRQNVPLSPARRLGADALVVVNPRLLGTTAQRGIPKGETPAEEAFPGPLFLLGKTLNALLLDRIDSDIDRLERINKILDAGVARFGESFLPEINDELGLPPSREMRPLRAVLIRASQDIGQLAAEFVRSARFLRRGHPGIIGRLMRRLADGEARDQADFLSYLLFDGEFAGELIELGRSDAAKQHDELCKLFDEVLRVREQRAVRA